MASIVHIANEFVVIFSIISLFHHIEITSGVQEPQIRQDVHTIVMSQDDLQPLHRVKRDLTREVRASSSNLLSRSIRSRRDAGDQVCKSQETVFLTAVHGHEKEFASVVSLYEHQILVNQFEFYLLNCSFTFTMTLQWPMGINNSSNQTTGSKNVK